MLLTALALTLAPTPQTRPAELTLNSEDRWALVTGLRHQLGGRFIIANLADSDATCRASHACVAASDIAHAASSIDDVPTLLANTTIDGEAPVAIVALRTGQVSSGTGRLYLTLSIFERGSDGWVNKDIRIAPESTSSIRPRQRLDRYRDSRAQLGV